MNCPICGEPCSEGWSILDEDGIEERYEYYCEDCDRVFSHKAAT